MIRPVRNECQSRGGRPAAADRASAGVAGRRGLPGAHARILPGGIAGSPCDGPYGRCYPLRALGAGTPAGHPGTPTIRDPGTQHSRRRRPSRASLQCPRLLASRSLANATHPRPTSITGHIERMDAKQVWRAALGELQVSLSPANFETWLRDTQLVDVDDQRFRIARPERLRQGLARDPLPLADQPDARPHRRLQRPGGVRRRPRAEGAAPPPTAPAPTRSRRRRRPARRPSRSASSRPASAARAARPIINPRYTFAQLHRRLGQPPRPRRAACRSPSARATPTTRSSCTAAWASARPT